MSNNPTFSPDTDKSGMPPPYSQPPSYAPPQNAAGGNMPPPPPGQFMGPQPPPGAYGAAPSNYPPPPPNQTFLVTNTTTTNNVGNMNSMVPVLPMWAAVLLCVVNCIFPGIGTMFAGMAVCCCAEVPNNSGSTKFGLFCVNFWMGWAQLFTVCFFLAGWVWSIWWGIMFITVSGEHYGKQKQVTTTTTVIQQIP